MTVDYWIMVIVTLAFIVMFFAIPKKRVKELSVTRSERKSHKQLIKTNYEQALKGTDKNLALQLGRKYYSSLRNYGILTIYDEQALANDLSTMKTTTDGNSN